MENTENQWSRVFHQ